MKKIFFMISLFFMFTLNVDALSNNIYSIDIDVYLDGEGNAKITETWNVNGFDGTEWYKAMYNLGNSNIYNYKVFMDGKELEFNSDWNIDMTLEEKKGYYGINYTDNGPELCFGKYDYDSHEFVLKYEISDFIFNTSDSQVLYFKFIDRLSDVDFDDFSINVSSYYSFPMELDVWGYGYKGFAYVENGVIKASNDDDMDDNYVVLLVKFPLDTFVTDNSYEHYPDFDTVLDRADADSYYYDYDEYNDSSDDSDLSGVVVILLYLALFVPFIFWSISLKQKKNGLEELERNDFLVDSGKYVYKDGKTITNENSPYFREIPCKKNIFYADALINMNGFSDECVNIIGAVILKWVKEKKVVYNKGTGNSARSLKFKNNVSFKIDVEQDLYNAMYNASVDGILEVDEFESWCIDNYDNFLLLFKDIKEFQIDKLVEEGHIVRLEDENSVDYFEMDDTLYKDSQKLYGLKRFLLEFSRIDKKEVLEVHLWDEYLMFAYLFGIADKVSEQLKKLYPELKNNKNIPMVFDLDFLEFIDNITYESSDRAFDKRDRVYKRTKTLDSVFNSASRYGSGGHGGGGFSRGGGGGGSFGGGGGGSR